MAAVSLTFSNNAANAAPNVPVITANPLSAIEREWVVAREAFGRRDIDALARARQQFSSRPDFPLSAYVTWWWISAQLAQSAQNVRALAPTIEQFANEQNGSPIVDQLRRDYLRALGKLDMWEPFAANQAQYLGDDSEVACQRLRYRLLADDRAVRGAVIADASALLLAAKPAAEPCYDVFERLVALNAVSTDDLWRRARPLFDAGQLADARRSVALIPKLPASFEAATASANLDPRHFLQRSVARPTDRAAGELVVFAITRLARTNLDAAALWLEKNGVARLSASSQAHAWAQIGYQGAMQQHTDALTWFARSATIGGYEFNDQQAGRLVRAALRATATDPAAWTLVKRTITQMSEAERRNPTWRYWLARALTALNNLDAARALKIVLANENHFYGVLTAEEMGTPIVPSFSDHTPSAESVARIAERPGVQRSFALYRLADLKPSLKDLRNDAFREWVFALRNADDETLLAAAEAARQQGLADRAINTAERTKSIHDFSQRYPLPHRERLQKEALAFGLDEAWIFGLIRQESRFMADARSRAGAIGLMQLMPATAKWAAQQVGVKNYAVSKVTDVGLNLSLGAFYLKHVLNDLGHPVLATAAYNAGPGRAKRWRADVALEGAIYAESIPFNETRDYVKKVMLNKWYYGYRIHGKSATLSELMGSVPGKSGARTSTTIAAAPTARATNGVTPQ